MKFTLLTRGRADYLVDRYSERKKRASELSKRVNLTAAVDFPAAPPAKRLKTCRAASHRAARAMTRFAWREALEAKDRSVAKLRLSLNCFGLKAHIVWTGLLP